MTDSYILFDIPGGTPKDKKFLENLGHRVMVCNGPAGGELCPILAGEGCPLAEGAEGIVFELDLDRPQHRTILEQYKETLREDLPIRVVVSPEQAAAYPDLLRGLKVLQSIPGAADLDGLAAEAEAASE